MDFNNQDCRITKTSSTNIQTQNKLNKKLKFPPKGNSYENQFQSRIQTESYVWFTATSSKLTTFNISTDQAKKISCIFLIDHRESKGISTRDLD